MFKNTLSIALAEATETQAWLDNARRRGYISESEYVEMGAAWRQIGAMLFLMIKKAATFRRR